MAKSKIRATQEKRLIREKNRAVRVKIPRVSQDTEWLATWAAQLTEAQ
jgi:hypothetical protein